MRALLTLCLLLLCFSAARADPECLVRIHEVHAARTTPDGERSEALAWTPVSLPHSWRELWPGYDGRVWYRIRWSSDCAGIAPLGMAVDSIVLAGEVYSNDDLIWRDSSLVEPLSRSWNMPRQWVLPTSSLSRGVNTVWIRVTGLADLNAGLGQVYLGPVATTQSLSDTLWWRNRSLYVLNFVVSLAMGGLFFCIWVVRRNQQDYGWYACTSLFWALFIGNVLMSSPWPFSDSLWQARVNMMAWVLYVASFSMFMWRFGEQSFPRLQCLMWGLSLILLAVLAWTPTTYTRAALTVGLFVPALIFVANSVQFIIHACRTRQSDHLVMAACLLVYMVVATHDLLMVNQVISSDMSYTGLTSVVAIVSMSAVLGMRIARNMSRVERFNGELAERVQEARAELRTSLALEHSLELANTRLQDRLQMAHDLHDGPGGSLVRMMALVEQTGEPLQNRQVLAILKQIRDDLRQTIDSGCSDSVRVPGTPAEWIAPLRHRFTALFDELGIGVQWDIAPAWAVTPDVAQCQALTRLLEESLTNVIKHSRARQVRVILQQSPAGRLALRIEDDGVGFDVDAVRRCGISVGMRSMQARIARVGGSLEIASRAGLTVLTATLPQ